MLKKENKDSIALKSNKFDTLRSLKLLIRTWKHDTTIYMYLSLKSKFFVGNFALNSKTLSKRLCHEISSFKG